MGTRSYASLALIIVGVLAVTIILSAIFSRAQQNIASDLVQDPAAAVTVVSLAPEKGQNHKHIPSSLEGIPVIVEERPLPTLLSHQDTRYRPVPVGAGILSLVEPGEGTLGPHIVRDIPDIGTCCMIWLLTAAHVIHPPSRSPSAAIGGEVAQKTSPGGTVAWIFQLTRCDSASDPGCSTTGPVSDRKLL
jgi:hypothetical protein